MISHQQQLAKAGDFEPFMVPTMISTRSFTRLPTSGHLGLGAAAAAAISTAYRRLHLPSPGKAQGIVRHHRLIVKAIGTGEPDQARSICARISPAAERAREYPRAASAISERLTPKPGSPQRRFPPVKSLFRTTTAGLTCLDQNAS